MEFINAIVDDIPNISVVTKIEVLRFNSSEATMKTFEDFVAESNVLELDELVVNHTILLCKARRIKLPDAIIAATAIINNQVLFTRNIGDFKNIEGLRVINPWNVLELTKL